MPVSLAALQALASSFTATRNGPQTVNPGQVVGFKLAPTSAGDLQVTDLVDGAVKMTWIAKNVRFNTALTEGLLAAPADPFAPGALDGLIAGGMPAIVPLVVPTPALNTIGTQQLTGVPGLLSQLVGSFPIPVQVPVQLGVHWDVLDDQDHPVAAGAGTYAAPSGTSAPEVSFVFAPQTVELTTDLTLPFVRRFIRATVTLTAGSTVHSFALPKIPVDIPAIPLPTLAVFFLHTNFAPRSGDDDGAALIVVPNNSPLRSLAQLNPVLATLKNTLSSLTTLGDFASFLLGLDELTHALPAQPHVEFRVANAANAIANLNDITLIQRAWYENDTEAEDELSSMILIGPSGKSVSCFNARSTGTGEGAFTVSTGKGMVALVRSLHSANPGVTPSTASLTVDTAPPGGIFNPDDFGDDLSSIRFN